MKLAGIVILYYPDIDIIIKNIKSYSINLDKLFIYDNTEKFNQELLESINKIEGNIAYFFTGKNEGIAKRLNEATQKAIEEGFDFLLTMDQDSSFKPGDFETFKLLIQQSNHSNVAQYGVNYQPDYTPIKDYPEETRALITSGSILNLALSKQVGLFNEDFFIDFVDTEFSYRIIQHGYINILFSNIVLNHALGTLVEGRGLGNFKKSMRIIHTPTRVFYIVRNGLYLLFKSKGLTSVMKKDVIRCIKIIKNDLIYNPQLFSVYKNVFAGIYAFMTNRMGKK
jgi:rhamnosyltransferase